MRLEVFVLDTEGCLASQFDDKISIVGNKKIGGHNFR
jgi:hypothetical protein